MLVALVPVVYQILHGAIVGSDAIFHFSRFYDTAMQIKSGKWSWFQTNYGFSQSGRVVNALYGPLFAYANGLLVLMTHSWFRYELVSTFVIELISGIGMFRLAKRVESRSGMAVILGAFYMNIGWLPRWQSAQNMTAWGAALAPYLVIVAVRMLQAHDRPVNKWSLALVISLMAQIHVLSTLIFVITLIPFWLVGMLQARHRFKMLSESLWAVVITLALSADVWASLLELMLKNQVAKPVDFNLAHNTLGLSWSGSSRDTLALGIVIVIITSLVLLGYYRDWLGLTVGGVGLFWLLLSSSLFPWAQIQAAMPILANDFQFPSRLTIVALPLLLVAIARVTTHFTKRMNLISGLIIMLLALQSLGSNFATVKSEAIKTNVKSSFGEYVIMLTGKTGDALRDPLYDNDLAALFKVAGKRTPDYLPVWNTTAKNLSLHYQDEVLTNQGAFHKQVLANGEICYTWTAKTSGNRQIPLIVYQQSQLTLNGKQVQPVKISAIGVPTIHQVTGQNTLIMKFQPHWWTPVMITISIGSWIILALSALVKKLIKFKKPAISR